MQVESTTSAIYIALAGITKKHRISINLEKIWKSVKKIDPTVYDGGGPLVEFGFCFVIVED